MTADPVLVVGDVHGHADRLVALVERAREYGGDFTVVQLGDLGHFGLDTRAGDREAWTLASEGLVDVVLWGNHDRAAVDQHRHGFNGYADSEPETVRVMREMETDGRLLLAYEAHGWLVTHAGLHAAFKYGEPDADRSSAASVARWLNGPGADTPFVNAVGSRRGGGSSFGGILWRDINEKLWPTFPQVFGHSASHRHEVRGERDRWWCVDVGGKGDRPGDECLAGVWLPSQETVRVDL